MIIPFLLKTHERILFRLPEVKNRLKSEGKHELAEDLVVAADTLREIHRRPSPKTICEADVPQILCLAEAFSPLSEANTETLAAFAEILKSPGMRELALKLGLPLAPSDPQDSEIANQIRRIILISVLSVACDKLVELEPDHQSLAIRAERLHTELDFHCRQYNSESCKVPALEMITDTYASLKEASKILLHAGDLQEARICSAFIDFFKEWITAKENASRIRNSE